MVQSGAFSRWKARPVALLLVVGALAVGLAACGSSSSTGAHGSTSGVKKEASAFASRDVQLTVVNKTESKGSLIVSVCDPAAIGGYTLGPCPEFNGYVLAYGKSAYRTHEDAVTGTVKDGAGNGFIFRAENPSVGAPFIELWGIDHPGSKKYNLFEGTTIGCLGPDNPTGCASLYVGQRKIVLYRDADTDRVKVLSITLLS
jgi:hypothetical protein